VSRYTCPVLSLFGGADEGIPQSAVDAFDAACRPRCSTTSPSIGGHATASSTGSARSSPSLRGRVEAGAGVRARRVARERAFCVRPAHPGPLPDHPARPGRVAGARSPTARPSPAPPGRTPGRVAGARKGVFTAYVQALEIAEHVVFVGPWASRVLRAGSGRADGQSLRVFSSVRHASAYVTQC
jgi:hypothetical protein